MIETEKAALRERFEHMTTDEKLFELAIGQRDPARRCEAVQTLEADMHGNGKPGVASEVQRLRWTVYALGAIAVAWKILPAAAAAVFGG